MCFYFPLFLFLFSDFFHLFLFLFSSLFLSSLPFADPSPCFLEFRVSRNELSSLKEQMHGLKNQLDKSRANEEGLNMRLSEKKTECERLHRALANLKTGSFFFFLSSFSFLFSFFFDFFSNFFFQFSFFGYWCEKLKILGVKKGKKTRNPKRKIKTENLDLFVRLALTELQDQLRTKCFLVGIGTTFRFSERENKPTKIQTVWPNFSLFLCPLFCVTIQRQFGYPKEVSPCDFG